MGDPFCFSQALPLERSRVAGSFRFSYRAGRSLAYLLCYIERNPLRAGLVEQAEASLLESAHWRATDPVEGIDLGPAERPENPLQWIKSASRCS